MVVMSTDLKSLLSEIGMRRADLARALKVNKSLVTRWSQRRVPVERVAAVSDATGIPKHKLRPDVFDAVEAAE